MVGRNGDDYAVDDAGGEQPVNGPLQNGLSSELNESFSGAGS
jgi:hypothetical protein